MPCSKSFSFSWRLQGSHRPKYRINFPLFAQSSYQPPALPAAKCSSLVHCDRVRPKYFRVQRESTIFMAQATRAQFTSTLYTVRLVVYVVDDTTVFLEVFWICICMDESFDSMVPCKALKLARGLSVISPHQNGIHMYFLRLPYHFEWRVHYNPWIGRLVFGWHRGSNRFGVSQLCHYYFSGPL